MKLTVFDMDHTLIANDCSVELAHQLYLDGHDPAQRSLAQQKVFLELYQQGDFDIVAQVRDSWHSLHALAEAEQASLLTRLAERVVSDYAFPDALAALQAAQGEGGVLIVSATIAPVTQAVAARLGCQHAIGMALDEDDQLVRPTSYQTGKPECIQAWLAEQNLSPTHITAYSDSLHDAAMLALADTAYVVNPDAKLLARAHQEGWQVLDWKAPPSA
ncbi:MAG: HAD-IB family phosphatase [Gammaproteobacteria bacterium]|nr:HAD-IB family phosphatase [Gammaproteobacteria bacterium]